jgi:3-deoxy-D-manno-octulosonic-acid transferase
MRLLYLIATRTYFFAIRIAALFNNKASLLIKGQKDWKNTLSTKIDSQSTYIWIHCASLGEFEQGRPLIEKFKSDPKTKKHKIVLSFFSPSGYEIRKDYQYADIVCYLPFDKKKNAKDFISIINPKFAVFVKYEFWYFYLKELENKNISAYIISTIFRKNQIFFKSYGKFYLNILKRFKHIFVQDQDSETLLSDKQIVNVDICGDTRTDRVIQIASENYNNKTFELFTKDKKTLICGSTWPEDEEKISELINESDDIFRVIIAPHEITEKHLKSLESLIIPRTVRFSSINGDLPKDTKVIIIDSIGLLSKLYRYGTIAYIGGGFGKGIHNILEAAVYNIPVIFGPNYKKFKEAVDLVNLKAAFSIKSKPDLIHITNKLLKDPSSVVEIRSLTKAHINQSAGSTQYIFNKMHNIGEF